MVSLRRRLSVLFGLWAVGTAGPPAGYLANGLFTGAVGGEEAVIVAGFFLLGTTAAAVGLPTEGLAERFRAGTELGLPMLLAAGTLLAALPISILWGVLPAVPFALGGTLGFLAAFLIGFLADQTIVDRSRATSDQQLRWKAKKRPEAQWFRAMRFVGIVAAFGVAVLVWEAGAPLLAGFWLLMSVLQAVLAVLSRRRRQYEFTDAGLLTAFGHLPWDEFRGYELTETALVLYGTRWPFKMIAYDRQSIDELDAVCEMVDQRLPEKPGELAELSVVEQFRRLLSS